MRPYPVNIVIRHQCSPDVNLGMDFPTEHQAINDLRSKIITLSTDEAIPSNKAQEHQIALNILDEEVTMPPRSSVVVLVGARNKKITEGIVKANTQLLFDGALGVARGIARFQNGQEKVLGTSFSEWYLHLNRGTTIAFLDDLTDIRNVAAISDQPPDGRPHQDHTPAFDINQSLPKERQDQIRPLH